MSEFVYGYKEPNKPYETRLSDKPLTLKDYQTMVNGHIEVYAFGDGILCVINEQGKLLGLNFNFQVSRFDAIVGNCVFVSCGYDDFCSLTQEQVELLENQLW